MAVTAVPLQRLSIIVTSYNYSKFIRAALDSALSISWPDVEIVVVDDGSTDDSLTILRDYGDRIALFTQENAGQRAAANVGYAHTSGDVVIFLDADDILPSDIAAQIAAAMGPGVSKVQGHAQRIDEHGQPYGRPFPKLRRVPDGVTMRKWMERTSAYPTPPGSANAYARWFLDRVMPVEDGGDAAADSALLAAAPLLGDVVTLPTLAAFYRRHDRNDSSLLSEPGHFVREIRRAQNRWEYASKFAGHHLDESILRASRELLQLRAAALRMTPDLVGLPGDGRGQILIDAIRSPIHPGPETVRHRVAAVIWTTAVVIAPLRMARGLIKLRWAGRA